MAQDHLEVDSLFLGMTRPPMYGGVTASFFMINAIACTILFLASKSFIPLLLGFPLMHVLGYLACLKDPRTFDVWLVRLKFMRCRNRSFWRSNSYDPG